jgi:hypothetical protein
MNNKTIIVAGCTRSGLTLMMQILYAGGYPCYGNMPAFENLSIDYSEIRGKAIKLVDTHRRFPPVDEYYVIRMHRNIKEQAKSIIKFGNYFGMNVSTIDENNKILIKSLKHDYRIIDSWAEKQKKVVHVDFETLINAPKEAIEKIEKEFDIKLLSKALSPIISRNTDCYDGLLEIKMI